MASSPRLLAAGEALLALLLALLCLWGVEGCRAATMLGSDRLYYLAGLLLYLAVSVRDGAAAVSALALAGGVVVSLKALLQLPRPPAEAWLAPAEGPGFPSGHSAAAAAFWLSLSLPRGAAAVAAAAALASMVGYTRLALRVHYPWDVAGGLAVGAAAAAAAYRLRGLPPQLAMLLLAAPGLAASAMAVAVDPLYRGGARMLGVTLGLTASSLLLEARGCTPRDPPSLGAAAARLALGFAGLAAAAALEDLLGQPAGGVAGFAVFAGLVAVGGCVQSSPSGRQARTRMLARGP